MRKCRGKLKSDNGQYKKGDWVYGYYVELIDGKKPIPCIYGKGEVDKSTVGEVTGLTDKNGKKIFEGDIVKVYARGYHTICTVSWAETVAHFQLWQINTIPNTPTALNLGNYDCEVIGNIHDNPELLKGGGEE